jgi:hypothetical protein
MKVILILTHILVFNLFAQKMVHTFSWFIENEDSIYNELSDSSKTSEKLINDILKVWHNRDGSVGHAISPFLVQALIYKTSQTLLIFKQNPEDFTDWINSIQSDVFTDYQGNKGNELKRLKYKLLNALENFNKHNNNNELKNLSKKVIEVIKDIQIREIN